eukprot:TRINITY_DN7937_c0_g3_i1.p3 TRINITY_DN7937_c0_g3~~TRINITY_DN7937_c0_g3_i1.p3  ORF type:complete len:131 (-),score=36.82 TRINITY_DN7937_c0_g3_i1:538-930(-)
MNKSMAGERDYSNCSIYMSMVNVYLKKRMYKEAKEKLLVVWELTEEKYGLKSLETVAVLEDLAEAYYKDDQFEEAIEYQKRVVKTYKEIEEVDPNLVEQASARLYEMYESTERLSEAIEILKSVRIFNNE